MLKVIGPTLLLLLLPSAATILGWVLVLRVVVRRIFVAADLIHGTLELVFNLVRIGLRLSAALEQRKQDSEQKQRGEGSELAMAAESSKGQRR